MGLKYIFQVLSGGENGNYESVGNSRLFAFVTSDTSMEEAKKRVYDALEKNIDTNILNYRKDIGEMYKH